MSHVAAGRMDKVVISSESSGAIYTCKCSKNLHHRKYISIHAPDICQYAIAQCVASGTASMTSLPVHRLPGTGTSITWKHWLLALLAFCVWPMGGCGGSVCPLLSLCLAAGVGAPPALSLSVSSHGGSAHPLLFHNSAHRFSLAEAEHEIERTENIVSTSPFLVSVLYFVRFFKYKKFDVWLIKVCA